MKIKFLFILLLLAIVGCRTSKTTTQEQKIERIVKDSITEVIVEKNATTEIYQEKKDTMTNNFEITFSSEQVGEIELFTPAGKFKAVKKGNGSVKFWSTQNSADISHSLEQVKKDSVSTVRISRTIEQKEQKKELKETKTPWYLRIWYVWVVLLVLVGLKIYFFVK